MSYYRTSYNNKPKAGVYAYLSAAADTTITTGGTFQYIEGTFSNSPLEGFSLVAGPAIRYDDGPDYFECDYHITFSCDDAARTVHVGIAVNGETLTTSSPSVMAVHAKTAGEKYSIGGTVVVYLDTNDIVQLQITSSADGDVVTVDHFTTTIRRFY